MLLTPPRMIKSHLLLQELRDIKDQSRIYTGYQAWDLSILDCTKVNLNEGAPVNLGVLTVRSADCKV